MRIYFLLSFLAVFAQAQTSLFSFNRLEPEELKSMIDEGFFDVIVDVRTAAEFNMGHIEGATLVESLASFGLSGEVSTPADLAGCEFCDIVVYCNSGTRAEAALRHLADANFSGRLFNGQGTTQWKDAGFPLVTTGSVEPECHTNPSDECYLKSLSYQSSGLVTTDGGSSSMSPITVPRGTPSPTPAPISAISARSASPVETTILSSIMSVLAGLWIL